jgi:hypothetical protein
VSYTPDRSTWQQLTDMAVSQQKNVDNCQIQIDAMNLGLESNPDDDVLKGNLEFYTREKAKFEILARDYAAIVNPDNDCVLEPE